MTPPPELVECANCDCWFADACADEIFFHATRRCCRLESAPAVLIPAESNERAAL